MRKHINWLSLAWFFFSNMIKQPLLGIACDMQGNAVKANWHYNETVESYCWLKIHFTYKSKRIK